MDDREGIEKSMVENVRQGFLRVVGRDEDGEARFAMTDLGILNVQLLHLDAEVSADEHDELIDVARHALVEWVPVDDLEYEWDIEGMHLAATTEQPRKVVAVLRVGDRIIVVDGIKAVADLLRDAAKCGG